LTELLSNSFLTLYAKKSSKIKWQAQPVFLGRNRAYADRFAAEAIPLKQA
jgi:hypothetical protein